MVFSAPENVKDVKVLNRSENSLTLMWDKVNNISTYFLLFDNNGVLREEIVSVSSQGATVTYEVSSLSAGTKYNFTLITVFEEVNSTGYTFEAVTGK